MGGSTGINVAGAVRLARELGPGHTIVTILCRLRLALSEQAVQPGVPEGARPAGAALGGVTDMTAIPWSPPTGWPSIWASPAWSCSTPAGTCRARGATPAPSTPQRHIPGAVFFDIDAISRPRERPAPHAAGAGGVRHRRAAAGRRAGLRPSWSTTASGSSRRRGSGGASAPWAMRARLRARRRAAEVGRRGPSGRGRLARARARRVQGAPRRRAGRRPRRRARSAGRTAARSWSTPAPPSASAARRRSRGPACAPATCRAPATCPGPAWSPPTAR